MTALVLPTWAVKVDKTFIQDFAKGEDDQPTGVGAFRTAPAGQSLASLLRSPIPEVSAESSSRPAPAVTSDSTTQGATALDVTTCPPKVENINTDDLSEDEQPMSVCAIRTASPWQDLRNLLPSPIPEVSAERSSRPAPAVTSDSTTQGAMALDVTTCPTKVENINTDLSSDEEGDQPMGVCAIRTASPWQPLRSLLPSPIPEVSAESSSRPALAVASDSRIQGATLPVTLPLSDLRSTACPQQSKSSFGVQDADSKNDNKLELRLGDLLLANDPLPVPGNVWLLSQSSEESSRRVQRAFDDATGQERANLALEVKGHVCEAAKNPHANHVLLKVVTTCPPDILNFIIDELLVESNLDEIAKHPFGCRIMEDLFQKCDRNQASRLVERLLMDDPIGMCKHKYGNFAMQQVIVFDSTGCLCQQLTEHVDVVGSNFFGSKVVCKALDNQYGEAADRLKLARAIINTEGLLSVVTRLKKTGPEIENSLRMILQGSERQRIEDQKIAPRLKPGKNSPIWKGRCENSTNGKVDVRRRAPYGRSRAQHCQK